jgi:hypothetical protein
MKSHVFGFALLSVVAIATSAPAHAQNGSLTRSFVSSSGVDTNPCTITQPCATFAQAYTAIGANGIIAALDPGRYGALFNITTGVTINGNGWAAITGPGNGNAITISAGTANVTLIGLEIDGAGVAYNGIVLNAAGSLTVTNCTLQNFAYNENSLLLTGNGILLQPTSGMLDFAITNTTVSNNGIGIIYEPPVNSSPSAKGVIDHVVASADGSGGIVVITTGASGGTTTIAVTNTIVSGSGDGMYAAALETAPVTFAIDNATITGNNYGIVAGGSAEVLLGRSLITGNSAPVAEGIGSGISSSGDAFYTYGNNQINLNGNGSGGTQDVNGTLNPFTTR